jgi:hypothetical protein
MVTLFVVLALLFSVASWLAMPLVFWLDSRVEKFSNIVLISGGFYLSCVIFTALFAYLALKSGGVI